LALSDRRRRLFENLKDYLADVRLTGWACEVLIDGSFVMPSVPEPNDIDIILVLPAGWDMARRDFKPYEYNVLDKSHTKRAYKIERSTRSYPIRPDSENSSRCSPRFGSNGVSSSAGPLIPGKGS
jgi:hypothetical protein